MSECSVHETTELKTFVLGIICERGVVSALHLP